FSTLGVARMVPPLLQLPGCALDGLTNAKVGSAAADVSAHRFLDVRVGGFRSRLQQRYCAHDLSALTIPALHDILFHPGVLHRSTHMIISYPFNGNDRTVPDQRYGHDTRACSDAGNVHRTRAARADPA